MQGGLDMEKKLKHLEMIQNIINRMANNSFLLKGWAVTLVAGIFALSNKEADKIYFLVAYIPVLVFWGVGLLLFVSREVISFFVR